jgi:hypothetical protein
LDALPTAADTNFRVRDTNNRVRDVQKTGDDANAKMTQLQSTVDVMADQLSTAASQVNYMFRQSRGERMEPPPGQSHAQAIAVERAQIRGGHNRIREWKPLPEAEDISRKKGAVDGALREIKVEYGRRSAMVLQVKPDDAVTELHTRIRATFQIPADAEVELRFGEVVLVGVIGDTITQNKSTVIVEVKLTLTTITIKMRRCSDIALDVAASDTIDNIKTKILDKTGIPPEEQRIVIGKAVLDDGARTLESLTVLGKAVLTLSKEKVKVSRATAAAATPAATGKACIRKVTQNTL